MADSTGVNRVFRDKPGGLVVDCLGLADQLKRALATHTESGGKGSPSIDTAEAIAVLMEKNKVCCAMMHGFDWSKWVDGTPAERLGLLPPAQEHILAQEDGKPRWSKAVTRWRRPPWQYHLWSVRAPSSVVRRRTAGWAVEFSFGLAFSWPLVYPTASAGCTVRVGLARSASIHRSTTSGSSGSASASAPPWSQTSHRRLSDAFAHPS